MGANGYAIKQTGGQFSAKEMYGDRQLPNYQDGIVLSAITFVLPASVNLFALKSRRGKRRWRNCVSESRPEKYSEEGRFMQPERTDKNSWTYLVIVDGRMYIRDRDILLCYELK
ncbi:MAG: hypothetical protein LBT46_01465 [Planctomycetaceae bacterium]|jgi:hypothetical protein|nr:hypothetical protein [Planctomycetaceae bacterium]